MAIVSAEVLCALHRILGQLEELRGRLDRGPKTVAAYLANVHQLEAAVAAAHDAVKQTRMEADRKQLELQSLEDKLQRWRGQLNAASSNTEYKTLQDQLAAGAMAMSVLEDEILDLLGRVDELSVAAGEAERVLTAGRGELARTEASVASAAEVLRGEVARLEGELLTAEATLPSEAREDYRRVVRGRGADGLSPFTEGVCQGCGQSITLNMQNDLKLSKLVLCGACGRLLYVPE